MPLLYDCFTFWAELDILEIRLAELYAVVDKFILVEALHTHKGDPKPLYYAENRRRFAAYNDKIIHIAVGDLPEGTTQAAIWRREIAQRQAIARGMLDVPDDTIVLISDLDEIPRREVVEQLRGANLDDMVITLKQRLYYYNVNTTCTNIQWLGTRATTAANVRVLTPDGCRWSGLRSHEYPRMAAIDNAGWHLSYFGDVAHIQNKMRAFLHQELVSDANLDPDTIARRMADGIDIWGRETEQQFTIGPAPDLPCAIRSNPMKWARYFHPDWRPDFHEDWYDGDQALYVGTLARIVPREGACIEIGCWEGRSTVCIAQAIAPRELYCVDHWEGNGDEGDDHSAAIAQERDIFAAYICNMERLTAGNTTVVYRGWRDWIAEWPRCADDPRIAFLHLDASHDYESVYECLEAVKPFLVPGAIVCGDDYYASGVYDGTHAALGERVQDIGGRLWAWQKEMG